MAGNIGLGASSDNIQNWKRIWEEEKEVKQTEILDNKQFEFSMNYEREFTVVSL
jgi:hypothetical protein